MAFKYAQVLKLHEDQEHALPVRLEEPYLTEEVALGDADVLLDALLLSNGHLRSGHTGETR